MTSRVVDKTGWSYTIIDNDIIMCEQLDIYEKMLYIVLKKHANIQTDEAFPGVKTLAKISGMSDRKAQLVLRSLTSKGFIDVELRTNKTSIYTLLPPSNWGVQDSGANDIHQGGEPHSPGGANDIHQGGEQGSPELKKDELKKDELKKENNNIEQPTGDCSKKFDKVKVEIEFDQLWQLYPNKKGKAVALKYYLKSRKDGVEYNTVREGLLNFITYCNENKWYKPAHGATWFNQQRWDDEYETSKGGGRNREDRRGVKKTWEDGVNF